LRYLVELVCSVEHTSSWFALEQSIRSGGCGFEITHGEPYFPYYEKQPECSDVFNKGMTSNTALWNVGALLAERIFAKEAYKNCKTLVDVGSGHGAILKEILSKHENLRGVVFDLDHVVKDAKKALDLLGKYSSVLTRLDFVAGDFFQKKTYPEVPNSDDIYMIANVLHNWDDSKAIEILTATSEAMSPKGKVLVIERAIQEVGGNASVHLLDISMMVLVKGKERTEEEFRHIFASAGLTISEIVRLDPTPYSAIIGEKKKVE